MEVRAGFASAASVWKLQVVDAEGKDHGGKRAEDVRKKTAVEDAGATPKMGTGKLVKPKKTSTKASNVRPRKDKANDLQHKEFAYDDAALTRRPGSSESIRPGIYDFGAGRPAPASVLPRNPGVNLSEYACQDGNHRKETSRSAELGKPVKKRRKKATADADANGELTAKKPRKRKPKSEPIILNSDEPEKHIASVHFSAPRKTEDQGLSDEPSRREGSEAREGRGNKSKTEQAKSTIVRIVDDARIDLSDKCNEKCPDDGAEKSTYFAKHGLATDLPVGLHPGLVQNNTGDGADISVRELAPRRRRSWTPVKDTNIAEPLTERPPKAEPGMSEEHVPKMQFTNVLDNFGYVSNNVPRTASLECAATGEAATKRRRIELEDALAGTAAARKAPESALPKPPKPPKKAQTITALATAAFRPPSKPQPEQSIVSEFFAPRKDEAAVASDPQAQAVKQKKSRKPRGSKSTTEAKPTKPKKVARTRKSKPKFDNADYLPKLYSPIRASAQLKTQGFLFATSSQLAVDKPPAFIKDMQLAMRESEMPQGSQVVSPERKSYMKVPTAPHGTCLSLEQGDRELWCAAARDRSGGIVKPLRMKIRDERVFVEQRLAAKDDDANLAADEVACDQDDVKVERSVVDLCHTSPLAPIQDTEPLAIWPERHLERSLDTQQDRCVAHEAIFNRHTGKTKEEDDNDSWMLLKSEDSDNRTVPSLLTQPVETLGVSYMAANKPFALALNRAGISSPVSVRSALQSLDVNISTFVHSPGGKDSTFGQRRAFSSTFTEQARVKPEIVHPRGQAHKAIGTDGTVLTSSKRRGRPPKQQPAPASDPSPHVPKLKKAKTADSVSQVTRQSEWLNIDEISDSDSPATPSPPRRRRATASPPNVQPLRLSPVSTDQQNSAIPANIPAAVTGPAPKPRDPQWPTIRSTLFPQITSAVKAAPASTDTRKPSWWEKILLYDPIVLENITAWLSAQGLRVSVRQRKAKDGPPKKRGRKRKVAEATEEVTATGDEAVLEWEVCEEDVMPWMVQKWCEEMSICCLWKEGLRGGVRTRY